MAAYAAFKHIELSKLGSSKKRVMKPSGGGNSDIFGAENFEEAPRSTKNHMRSNIFSEPDTIAKNSDLRSAKVSSHNRLFGTPEHTVPCKPIVKSNNIFGGGDAADAPVHATNENGKLAVKDHTNKQIGYTNDGVGYDSQYMFMDKSYKSYDVLDNANNNDLADDALSVSSSRSNNSEKKSSKNPHTIPIMHIVGNNHYGSNVCHLARNPVIGSGIDNDGIRSRKRGSRQGGNPVTGEGYKPAGAEINTQVPALNGNHIINKNRIPPGGYSSGLW